ncbi:unnamed protein product [Prunus brigantina]
MPIYVQDLIDPDTKTWRSAEVNRLFREPEAKLINGLTVSRWGCPDKLIWHFTKHGGFTVKSAYEVAQFLQRNGELGRQGQGESSVRNTHRPIWTSIWKLQAQPKLRSFLWRACLNALAVRQNLKRRHVELEDVCAICGNEGKSQVHLFFHCKFTKVFWFTCLLQLDTRVIIGGDFLSCWQFLLQKYTNEDNYQDILQCNGWLVGSGGYGRIGVLLFLRGIMHTHKTLLSLAKSKLWNLWKLGQPVYRSFTNSQDPQSGTATGSRVGRNRPMAG